MKSLSIDIETYSEANLAKTGVYRYAADDSFDILLFGVSVDEQPVVTYDLACGEKIPDELLEALVSKDVIKYAFNASFERVCLSVYLRKHYPALFHSYGDPNDSLGGYLDPSSWRCDMVLAAYNGLPLSLAGVGSVLGFEKQKLSEGKDLVRYFCTLCKPTKSNGMRTRNRPSDDPQKWEMFKKYNIRDVEVQLQIHERLKKYPVPDSVWNEYFIDQAINDRGVQIDQTLVQEAIDMDAKTKDSLTTRMKELTGMENPNSVQQLKEWLCANGIQAESLGKKDVKALIDTTSGTVKEVLELRLQLAKSSVKKYEAMRTSMCPDGRCRGLFQFYGANRTGRWAGRLIQLQNLYRNSMPDLDVARNIVKSGDYDWLSLMYDDVPDVLAQLIRTALVPKPGYKFVVSDFSSIEARVLAYLAGETWKTDAFARGEDIYCSTASRMFEVPVVKHGINGELRQKGKIAELACGYGGSVGALTAMGALDMGLKEEELQPIVNSWREANSGIVQYWWDTDKAVKDAIRYHLPTHVGNVEFFWSHNMLFVHLPSGRRLSYVKPRIEQNKFGGESITYMGLNGQKKWTRIESYGPKIVENVVQAIARDILCNSMKNLKDLYIVGHVHDELIIEVPEDADMQTICDTMGRAPDWMPDIQLRADGYECSYYMKD